MDNNALHWLAEEHSSRHKWHDLVSTASYQEKEGWGVDRWFSITVLGAEPKQQSGLILLEKGPPFDFMYGHQDYGSDTFRSVDVEHSACNRSQRTGSCAGFRMALLAKCGRTAGRYPSRLKNRYENQESEFSNRSSCAY